jgi:large subunit ribosomal protein L10
VNRAEKRESVDELSQVFKTSGVVVVAQYSGLTVSQMTDLRRRASGAGAALKVAKNRLAKIALEGTEVAHLGNLLKGPTVLAYSEDPIAATKVVSDFAKGNDKLVILGGAMGATSLTPDAVKQLASLPSMDELRAKILGLLQAPSTKIAQLTSAPAAQLARVFGAYATRDAA